MIEIPSVADALAGKAGSVQIGELIKQLSTRRSEVLDRLTDVGPPRRHEEPQGARKAALLAGDVQTIQRFDEEAKGLTAELASLDAQLPELARQRDAAGDRETSAALPELLELLDTAVARAEDAAERLQMMLTSAADRFDDVYRARVRTIRARLPAASATHDLVERIERLRQFTGPHRGRCWSRMTDLKDDIGG